MEWAGIKHDVSLHFNEDRQVAALVGRQTASVWSSTSESEISALSTYALLWEYSAIYLTKRFTVKLLKIGYSQVYFPRTSLDTTQFMGITVPTKTTKPTDANGNVLVTSTRRLFAKINASLSPAPQLTMVLKHFL